MVLIPLELVHPPVDATNWLQSGLVALLIVVCTGSAAMVAVPRLHDVGLSGWYALALVVPVLNLPPLLLLLVLPGKPGENKWGVVPLPYPRLTIPQFALGGFRLSVSNRNRL
jgi:uncharacterized membrane protein YhaH (DUF805 family)